MAFVLCLEIAQSQVPQFFSLQLYVEESGIPLNGTHTLWVRWYNVAVGGGALFSEEFVATISDGITTVLPGSTKPLPPDLLRQGPLWIGVSVNGNPELSPRTILASVPYAMYSERSQVAEALSPDVTGVVTSVNEIAGAVNIVSGYGVRVTRSGNRLVLDTRRELARGIEQGRLGVHRYAIALSGPIPSDATIHATVDANTYIGVTIQNINTAAGTFEVVTSAPLLPTETITWFIN